MELPEIDVTPVDCQTEWIVTNGLGGYASSTSALINTRKYHGLLVAAMDPPGDRRVILTRLDESIVIGEKQYLLWSNQFEDTVWPEGKKHIKGLSIAPFPSYRYFTEEVMLNKTIFMPYGKNATVVGYDVSCSDRITLNIHPQVSFRHFHSVA